MTSGSGALIAYAAMLRAIDAPATANCVSPNPSNGFTARPRKASTIRIRIVLSLTTRTPRVRSTADRMRGSTPRLGGVDDSEDVRDSIGRLKLRTQVESAYFRGSWLAVRRSPSLRTTNLETRTTVRSGRVRRRIARAIARTGLSQPR